jgi:uncharacterized membrane protein YphA (DoxX/SURF4 family)
MTEAPRDGMVWDMNELLLILRLAFALYLVVRATARVRDVADGPELAMGAVELAAGVLLAFGLLMPLAGLLLVAVTANLAFVSWPHEYPLYLLFAAVAIALAGPGDYALDHTLLGGSAAGTGTLDVAAGLAGALAIEGRRQLQKLQRVREEPENAG